MLQLVLVFALFTGVSYYLAFRRSRKRLYELAATFPGPFDLPLVGSSYIGYGLNPTSLVQHLLGYIHKLRSPFRAWMGPSLGIVFDQPKHLAVILNSPHCVQKSMFQKFFRFDKGIINGDRDVWRVLRKRLGPPFSNQIVGNFVPLFNQHSDKLMQYLDRFVGEKAIDVLPKMSVYALSATLTNLFGVELHTNEYNYMEQFTHNTERMFSTMFRRVYKPWLYPEFIYRLTPSYKIECQRIAKLRSLSQEIAAARKATQPKSRPADSAGSEILIERLERLTFETGELDLATLMDNIDTFLFASVDTTSSVVSTTLLMMAMHPDVQERVHREVIQAVTTDQVTLEDIPNLAYLEQVIKETMRLIPIATILNRICEKELQVEEWTVPAGAFVAIPVLKLHRDREIWGERSEEFDPDNFLPERCAQRHPYAYIPFSAGIRNCIGMRYAWLSMKVLLAKLVKRYRFETDLKLKELKLEASFMLQVADRHMVRIKRR